VIDTAYLYELENQSGASPSLRDICENVLSLKLPDIHDSVLDARVALQAALVYLLNGPTSPIQRLSSSPCSLFVHRIPDFCTVDQIKQLFVTHTHVAPREVLPIENSAAAECDISSSNSSANKKTTVHFLTQEHSELAFDTLAGPDRPDKFNRSQKRVYLKGGGYICVRKF